MIAPFNLRTRVPLINFLLPPPSAFQLHPAPVIISDNESPFLIRDKKPKPAK